MGRLRGIGRWLGILALLAVVSCKPSGPEGRLLIGSIPESGAEVLVDGVVYGETPLRLSAAILLRAHLLVTNDSAPLHLAGAVGTPVVAIFGPTVPAFGFGPLGPDDVIVEEPGLECRPCSPHGPMTCPLGHHRCMLDISVDTVESAVRRVWRAAAETP